MPNVPMTEEELAELLEEAAEAHHAYEEDTGTTDENWPRWYARYIMEQIREDEV